MSFLIAKFVRNGHISARIYFIFIKNLLKQTWNCFNTKFGGQRKNGKGIYQWSLQILAIFSKLILGWNSVESLRITKIVKQINFGGTLG